MKKQKGYYALNMSTENSHVEALTPNVSQFGDVTSKEVIKVK